MACSLVLTAIGFFICSCTRLWLLAYAQSVGSASLLDCYVLLLRRIERQLLGSECSFMAAIVYFFVFTASEDSIVASKSHTMSLMQVVRGCFRRWSRNHKSVLASSVQMQCPHRRRVSGKWVEPLKIRLRIGSRALNCYFVSPLLETCNFRRDDLGHFRGNPFLSPSAEVFFSETALFLCSPRLDFHPAKGFTYGNSISKRCRMKNSILMLPGGGFPDVHAPNSGKRNGANHAKSQGFFKDGCGRDDRGAAGGKCIRRLPVSGSCVRRGRCRNAPGSFHWRAPRESCRYSCALRHPGSGGPGQGHAVSKRLPAAGRADRMIMGPDRITRDR